MDTLKVIITYGLPGSGKTHFCNEVRKKWLKPQNNRYLSLDQVAMMNGDGPKIPKIRKILDAIKHEARYCYGDTLIIDGLITTIDALKDVIEACMYSVSTVRKYEFYIHVWNEDREACEMNDFGRVKMKEGRYVLANETLKNIPYDDVTPAALMKIFNEMPDDGTFEIKRHNVVVKQEYVRYFQERNLFLEEPETPTIGDDASRYLISKRWCLGGSAGNYLGHTSYVSAEDTPQFEELYELLEHVCPELTFINGMKIMKELVEVCYDEEGDYYGGRVTYARYKISYEALYEMLKSFDEE